MDSSFKHSLHRMIALTLLLLAPGAFAKADFSSSLPIQSDQLEFEFGSQNGDFTTPCRHELLAASRDWRIECGQPHDFGGVRRYTLHLVVKLYTRPQPPKLSFQILHWLTDHQVPSGSPGHFVGSTVWFRVKDESSLHSFDIAQDVENINVLRMRVKF